MKCLRCGKIVNDDAKECPECGFDLEELKKYKKIIVETDAELDKKSKIVVIDNPILTFVFGILAVMLSLVILFYRPISLVSVLLFFLAFSASFYFSTKPTRVKMRPVRTFGICLAFIGLAITLFTVINVILSILGIFNRY